MQTAEEMADSRAEEMTDSGEIKMSSCKRCSSVMSRTKLSGDGQMMAYTHQSLLTVCNSWDPIAILMGTRFRRRNKKESTNSLRGFWCSAKY